MSSQTLSTKLHQIAARAADKARVFTTLAHLIDEELLLEAYRLTRKGGAPGIDGQTGAQYAENLESNLRDLHERLRTRQYRATPARRVRIRKEDGSERPIAVSAFEDKVVQRAVVMLLSAIYEQDFYGFSYGFRPGVGAHDALRALRRASMDLGGGWVVDADIRGFFDGLDRGILREILRRRVNDGGILRLLGKWFNAGVVDGGELIHPETGTPQGSVVSPLLANIYLHTVLDEWFAQVVQPRLRGRSSMVRFADDFIILCELEQDARRVLAVLPKRLAKYGLSLHPDKTRLVRFRRPALRAESPKANGNGTFDFLGFTHYWARSRRGFWVVKKRTMRKRLRRAMRAAWLWCKHNRHRSLREQHWSLSRKLRGHYAYYAVTGNYEAVAILYEHTRRAWRRWLSRRSRESYISWEKFPRIEASFPLPLPRIVHADA